MTFEVMYHRDRHRRLRRLCKLELPNCPAITTLLRSVKGMRGTGWQSGDQETPDVLDKLHTSALYLLRHVNAPVDLRSHLDGDRPIAHPHFGRATGGCVVTIYATMTMTTTMTNSYSVALRCVVFRQVTRTLFHRWRPHAERPSTQDRRATGCRHAPLFGCRPLKERFVSALWTLNNPRRSKMTIDDRTVKWCEVIWVKYYFI